MNNLRTVIAVWLNASQRSRVDAGMNKSARSEMSSALIGPTGWILCYIKKHTLTLFTGSFLGLNLYHTAGCGGFLDLCLCMPVCLHVLAITAPRSNARSQPQ